MKKIVKFVFALSLVALVLAACSAPTGTDPGNSVNEDEANRQEETTGDRTGKTETNRTEKNESNRVKENESNRTEKDKSNGESTSLEKNATKAAVKRGVTLYFSDDQLMEMYGEKRQIEAKTEDDLPKAALTAWLRGPEHEQLTSILPSDVTVLDVAIEGETATVNLSKAIQNANLGSGGEQFVLDQVALIMLQFGASHTQLLIDGQIEQTLAGHMTISEPYKAPDPAQFKIVE
ncbi:GerMN domain-containing protein [Numidum massiliense]|uniref:GerMN domain-containing protein n=1 Tax=Numidum massiliense TaxID=1522315 RepID=UPI0006D54D78|nr:GerMN domain-containing protein [Numidum massiliense]